MDEVGWRLPKSGLYRQVAAIHGRVRDFATSIGLSEGSVERKEFPKELKTLKNQGWL
jgi:hypothetical protein